MARIARQWRRAVDVELLPYGLTEATWLPLLRLARNDVPMRQKDLAESLSLDGSSVVRLLDNLQVAGLVTRTEHASDRRAKSIELTAAGRETVAHVEEVALLVRNRVLASIAPAAIDTTLRTLDQIAAALGTIVDEDAA